jgi:nucleoside-diphosphate-sugar epimerase
MPELRGIRKRVLVLGAGYVGKAVFAGLSAKYEILLTSRSGRSGGKGTPQDALYFALQFSDSWSLIDCAEYVVWTFPAAVSFEDLHESLELCRQIRERGIPLLILASTSCYQTSLPDQLVDENFPLDLSQARVCAEAQLLEQGACVLVLAGIYGQGRDPVQWLKRGLVKNRHQYINFIHVSDIVKIIGCWLENPLENIRINASDGRHRRWSELAEQLLEAGLIEKELARFSEDCPSPRSKRIDNSSLLKKLYFGPFHRYPEDGL